MKNCTVLKCDGKRFNVIIFSEQPIDGEVNGKLVDICPTCDDCNNIESGISDNHILMNNNGNITDIQALDIINNVINNNITVHGIGRHTTEVINDIESNSVRMLWKANGVGNQLPGSITPNCL